MLYYRCKEMEEIKMRKSMIIGTLIKLERLNNSVWGNLRYRVIIKDE